MADINQVKLGVEFEPDFSSLDRKVSAWQRGPSSTLKMKIETAGGFGDLSKDVSQFTSYLDRANQRVISFTSSVSVLYGAIKVFKDIVSSTLEVDKAIGDINSTLKLSSAGIADYSNRLFDAARSTSASFANATAAAQAFVRQGLSVEESLKRTRDALTLSRIANIDAKEAVDQLTAATNIFARSGSNTHDILNKISAATSQFNVNSKDITEAMERFGATAQNAGVNLDQFIALIASAKQATQRDGAAIGVALNTIFTRLEPQKALDQLKAFGVAVTDVAGHALPTLQIIQNLAATYNQAGDSAKAGIDKIVGGARQLDILKGLFATLNQQNGTFVQVQNAVANSTDNATVRMQVQNRELTSLIQNFQSAFKQIGSNIGNQVLSPLVRGPLSGLTNNPITAALEHANADAKTGGEQAAKGFIEGFGNAVVFGLGPILIRALGAITIRTFNALKNDILSQTGLNTAAKQQEATQAQIVNLYKLGGIELREQLAAMTNLADKAALVQSYLAAGAAARGAATAEIAGVTKIIAERGGFAGGYLPLGSEAAAIASGVGGAPSSARPVVLNSFPFGNGRVGSVVANDSEYIVPNFANGGSAIFNRNMISHYGLPPGSIPIAPGGYIPGDPPSALDLALSRTDPIRTHTPLTSSYDAASARAAYLNVDAINEVFEKLANSAQKAGPPLSAFEASVAATALANQKRAEDFNLAQAQLSGLGGRVPGVSQVYDQTRAQEAAAKQAQQERLFAQLEGEGGSSFVTKNQLANEIRAGLAELNPVQSVVQRNLSSLAGAPIVYGESGQARLPNGQFSNVSGRYEAYRARLQAAEDARVGTPGYNFAPIPPELSGIPAPSSAAIAAEVNTPGFFSRFRSRLNGNVGLQLGASFALPFAGGALDSAFGAPGGTAQGIGVGAASNALNFAGSGLAVGSLLGGPLVGGAIGAVAGALVGALTKLHASFDDVTKSVEDLNSKNRRLVETNNDYRAAVDKISQAKATGASSQTIAKLEGQRLDVFNSISDEKLRAQYVEAGSDPDKLNNVQNQITAKAARDSQIGISTEAIAGLREHRLGVSGFGPLKGIAGASVAGDSISSAAASVANLLSGQSLDTGALNSSASLLSVYAKTPGLGSFAPGGSPGVQALEPLRKAFQGAGVPAAQVDENIKALSKLNYEDLATFLRKIASLRDLSTAAAGLKDIGSGLNPDKIKQDIQDLIDERQSAAENATNSRSLLARNAELQRSFNNEKSVQDRSFTRESNSSFNQFSSESSRNLTEAASTILGQRRIRVGGLTNRSAIFQNGEDLASNFRFQSAQEQAQRERDQVYTAADERERSGGYQSISGKAGAQTVADNALGGSASATVVKFATILQGFATSGQTDKNLASIDSIRGKLGGNNPDFYGIAKSINDIDQSKAGELSTALKTFERQNSQATNEQKAVIKSLDNQTSLAHSDAENMRRLADQKLTQQNILAQQLLEIQKVEAQAQQKSQLLQSGTFNLGSINKFSEAIAASTSPGVGRYGRLGQVNGSLEQSRILDQLGLPRGQGTAEVEDGLRQQSVLGTLSALNSRKLGKPVGADINSLTGSANELIASGTTNNVLLGNRTLDSLKALQFDPRAAAAQLLSKNGASADTLRGLQASGQISTGETGIIAGVKTSNDILKQIADNTTSLKTGVGGGTKPIATVSTDISGVPLPSSKSASTSSSASAAGISSDGVPAYIADKTPSYFNQFASGLNRGIGTASDAAANINEIGAQVGANVVDTTAKFFNAFAQGQINTKKGDAFRQFAAGIFGNISSEFGSSAIKQLFGAIPGLFAEGGTVPAMLTGGEYYVSPSAARNIGYDKLKALNYAGGGLVQGGSGLKDDVRANVAPGAFILKKSAVTRLGPQNLQALTSRAVQARAGGGPIFGYAQDGSSGYSGLIDFSSINTNGAPADMSGYSDPGLYGGDAPTSTSDTSGAGFGGSGGGGSAGPNFGQIGAQSAISFLAFLVEKLFQTTYHTLSPQGVLNNAASLRSEQQSQLSSQAPGYHAYLQSNGRGGYSIINEGDPGATANVQNFSANGGIIAQPFDVGGPVGSVGGSNAIGGSAASVAITIHNYPGTGPTSQSTTQSTYGSADFADRLNKQVQATVKQVLIDEQRPGGIIPLANRTTPFGATAGIGAAG